MANLSGKRAIVSGASLGIGRAVAIELARSGAEVVINFRSHELDALQAVAECEEVEARHTRSKPILAKNSRYI